MTRDALDDFERRPTTLLGRTYDVYVAGEGPAVLVLPEIPGITPDVADCARRLIEAGFSVWVPSLFGTPGRSYNERYAMKTIAKACISRQFAAFARAERAPIIDWLRELGALAQAESGGEGIGVIGMCFTGNFALALAIDGRVKVPVMSQPSLPLGRSSSARRALSIARDDLDAIKQRVADDDLCVIGLRFTEDVLVPAERFSRLRKELGDGFIGVEIYSGEGNNAGFKTKAHSVLTAEWSPEPDHPAGAAFDLVVAHLTKKLLAVGD